MFTPAG